VGNKTNSFASNVSSIWSCQNGHNEIFILDKDSDPRHKTDSHSPHRKVKEVIPWQSQILHIIVIYVRKPYGVSNHDKQSNSHFGLGFKRVKVCNFQEQRTVPYRLLTSPCISVAKDREVLYI
jgi:hypothetical protein